MKKMLKLLIVFLLLGFQAAAQTKYEKDFLEFWNDFNDNFAYFDKSVTNWQKMKEIYKPKIPSFSLSVFV